MNEWRLLISISISFQSNNVVWVKRLLKEKCCWFVVNCALVRSLNKWWLNEKCSLKKPMFFFSIAYLRSAGENAFRCVELNVFFFVPAFFRIGHDYNDMLWLMWRCYSFFALPFFLRTFFLICFSPLFRVSVHSRYQAEHIIYDICNKRPQINQKKCDYFGKKNTLTQSQSNKNRRHTGETN